MDANKFCSYQLDMQLMEKEREEESEVLNMKRIGNQEVNLSFSEGN